MFCTPKAFGSISQLVSSETREINSTDFFSETRLSVKKINVPMPLNPMSTILSIFSSLLLSHYEILVIEL